jgi:heme/copper-type cytochrome/quinol oxidase subunit 2
MNNGFRGAVAVTLLAIWAVFVMLLRERRYRKNPNDYDESDFRKAHHETVFYIVVLIISVIWLIVELFHRHG